jgi:hypothetical protein
VIFWVVAFGKLGRTFRDGALTTRFVVGAMTEGRRGVLGAAKGVIVRGIAADEKETPSGVIPTSLVVLRGTVPVGIETSRPLDLAIAVPLGVS